jgi:hypothetical protein
MAYTRKAFLYYERGDVNDTDDDDKILVGEERKWIVSGGLSFSVLVLEYTQISIR